MKKVPAQSNITKTCLLCLHEKLEIINYPYPEEFMNKGSELVSNCWHANMYLLSNYEVGDKLLHQHSRIYAILFTFKV